MNLKLSPRRRLPPEAALKASPFKKLTLEIRNMIYKLALTHPYPLKLVAHGQWRGSRLPFLVPGPIPYVRHANVLALTTVCRKFRAESLHIFLGHNTFTLVSQPGDALPGAFFSVDSTNRLIWVRNQLGRWLCNFRHDLRFLHGNLTIELDFCNISLLSHMITMYRVCAGVYSAHIGEMALGFRIPSSPFLIAGMDAWFELHFHGGSNVSLAREELAETMQRMQQQAEANIAGLDFIQADFLHLLLRGDEFRIGCFLDSIELTPVWWQRTVNSQVSVLGWVWS